MKIAIFTPYSAPEPTGGVKLQGLMWKEGLEKIGDTVDLINFWDNIDWKSYDAVISLGFGGSFRVLTKSLIGFCKKLALAPIIDPAWNKGVYKFIAKYWGNQKYLGLSSRFHDLYIGSKYYDVFLVRSEFEKEYVNKCLDIPLEKIKIVPLSIRTPFIEYFPEKENFCFHSSRLAAKNKNVERLINAAKKYKFKLALAGFLNGDKERIWLENLINGYENISYVGLLSEQDLIKYYKRAKVFALPSINEGVGMVALEAASYGCEIVLTNVGAPQHYYEGRAYLVNPYDVDDIGLKILEAMERGNKQPELKSFVEKEYSMEKCSKLLHEALLS